MEVIDRDGVRRRLRPGEMLRDGDRLTVSSAFMDHAVNLLHDGLGGAAGHRPGYVFASEPTEANDKEMRDRAAAARRDYEARIATAWRKP